MEIFCYPGDTICKSGGYEVASIFIVTVACEKFSRFFTLMNSPSVSFHRYDQSCKGCVCGSMPCTSDCWVSWSEDNRRCMQYLKEDTISERRYCKS